MSQTHTYISISGKSVRVPSLTIAGLTVVITGRWLKIGSLRSEAWLEGEIVPNPEGFIHSLKEARPSIDVFTFAQKPCDTQPAHRFYAESYDIAAIRTDSFEDWWKHRLPQETRKNVRRAGKRGVVVRSVEFTDELVRGLKQIYDETPVRQGRKFWHYGKDVETIKAQNSTYLERSELLGAFHGSELIGFLKIVFVDNTAQVMQIVAKNAHADKRPMNALIAKAVEICEQRGLTFFIYGQYSYGGESAGQLTEFKRRNGFERILRQRYYVPLTAKGHVAIWLRLHRGTWLLLPGWLRGGLLKLRARYYQVTGTSKAAASG